MLKKIMDMLQLMDKKTMDENFRKVQEYANTPEGKKLIDELQKNGVSDINSKIGGEISDADKEKLINEVTKNPELLKMIGNLFNGRS